MWVIMGYRLYKGVYPALYSKFLVESCLPDPVSQSQGLREFWRITIMKSIEVPSFVDQIICSPLCSWFFTFFSRFSLRWAAWEDPSSSIVAGSEDRWLPRNHAMSYVVGILVTALGGHWTCL